MNFALTLKTESDPKKLSELYKYWKEVGLGHYYVDFSIAYSNFEAIKVLIEVEGENALTKPYSE